MIRTSLVTLLSILFLVLSACAGFDKNNIRPGQRVEGPGFTFAVPTENAWFAVIYGNSNRIRLSQLNENDSYILQVTLNRGPRSGMYSSVEDHLAMLKRHNLIIIQKAGHPITQHHEEEAPLYGPLCVRYSMQGEDARGRGSKGAALVERIGLSCPHQSMKNVLINFELSRRADASANTVNLARYADELFASIRYDD